MRGENEQPILVGIPSQEDWKADFGVSLGMMIARCAAVDQLWIAISNLQGTVIPTMRNLIAQYAINQRASHLLFLDSDMRFPAETLSTLLSHNQAIVGATYCMRKEPYCLTHRLLDGSSALPSGEALFEVESAGMGCMLIRADVLHSVPGKEPFFKVETEDRYSEHGEDVYFCHLVRSLGFNIWIDPVLSRFVEHVGAKRHTLNDAKYVRKRNEM